MGKVRLTEEQLDNIISESINKAINEGFVDRLKGGMQGFSKGADTMQVEKNRNDYTNRYFDDVMKYVIKAANALENYRMNGGKNQRQFNAAYDILQMLSKEFMGSRRMNLLDRIELDQKYN